MELENMLISEITQIRLRNKNIISSLSSTISSLNSSDLFTINKQTSKNKGRIVCVESNRDENKRYMCLEGNGVKIKGALFRERR